MTYHFRTWSPTAEDIDLLVQIGTGESTNLEFKLEMPEMANGFGLYSSVSPSKRANKDSTITGKEVRDKSTFKQ